MRTVMGALVGLAFLQMASAAQAMPVPSFDTLGDSIINVSGGCGAFGHRGPMGGCQPDRGYRGPMRRCPRGTNFYAGRCRGPYGGIQ